MAKKLRFEFLKLEFKELYDQLFEILSKNIGNSENALKNKQAIYSKATRVVEEIIFNIYKKNKILYDDSLDNKANILILNRINIVPQDIMIKLIGFIEETDNYYKRPSGFDESKNIKTYIQDKDNGFYDILAWFVVNCGTENYELILDGLEQDERQAFNRHLKVTDELEKPIDDEVKLSPEELKERLTKYIEQGENYYFGRGVKKNNREALKYFLRAAKYGNEYGQAYLGLFYERGLSVKKDYLIASKWYLKAATKGNSFAQYSLGVLYLDGNGVRKDYKKALMWLEKSAESDYIPAYYQIGRIYYYGYGIDKDLNTAFKWYSKASEQNFGAAQHALSFMYKNGEGCKQSKIKAYYWIEKAAENEYEDAYFIVGKSYLDGIVYDVNYEKAFYYLNKGYEELDTNCIESLADMYYKGLYVKKDVMKAIELYNKSIDNNNKTLFFKVGKIYEEQGLVKQAISYYVRGHEALDIKCTQRLGVIYYNGEGVSRDLEKAIKYMEKAAEQKAPHAMYVLGVAYLRLNKFGENTSKISTELLKEAYELKSPYAAEYLAYILINQKREGKEINEQDLIKYIKFGVENNIADSYFQYGYIYNRGIAVEENLEKAYNYFSIAAGKGSVKAMLKLADWYKRGKFLCQNINLSIKWYEEAAKLNDVDAIERLIDIYEQGIGGAKSEIKALYYVFKLIEIDALKGKSKLAYYCYSGIGIEKDVEKGKYILDEIEEIDKGTANNLKCFLAQKNLIEMSEAKIVETYVEGIESGNLQCYGDLAVYLYENNLYKKDKYKESFNIAMTGKDLNVKKCNYIYLITKLNEKIGNKLVTVEEILLIKQLHNMVRSGFYLPIKDLLHWYSTRRKEDEESYYKLKREAIFYNINSVSEKPKTSISLILSLIMVVVMSLLIK